MKHTQIILYLFVSILLVSIATGCGNTGEQKAEQELGVKLQALVDSLIDHDSEDPIHNAVLLVESPKIKWKGAAGLADGKQEVMTVDHKIKIASIAKTFTATVILQLVEEGVFDLDDTIDRFLDNQIVMIDTLHIYEGTTYGRQITVEHLLRHTSGIADYMEDPRFIPGVLEDPLKQYNPEMILELYYKYETNRKALFVPGDDFNYSDVNYVLLAMIIEKVSGDTYQSQLKKRIFDQLGMENSYLEYYEEPRGNQPLSHAFFSTVNLVTEVNTSFDWGGGGIVSTCDELNKYFRALVDGKMFKEISTLRLMLDATEDGLGGEDYLYGMGIMKRSIHGLTFYGHGGAYDCDVFYCPEKNISIVMSLNQMMTHGKRDEFLLRVIELVM
jgi:D-alanyl-D-alanine carboxypeptidase